MQTRCKSRTAALLAASLIMASGLSACGGRKATPSVAAPDTPGIYSVPIDGSPAKGLNVAGIGLSRGPDGRIAFLHGRDLAVMNDDGSGLRMIGLADPGSEVPSPPSWSPGGGLIAAGNGRGCSPYNNCLNWRIPIVKTDGGHRVGVIHWGKAPSWSPNGRSLVFQGGSAAGDHRAKTRYEIEVSRRDGSGRRKLAVGGLPAWSPNAKLIAFFALHRLQGIHVVRPDGHIWRRLPIVEPTFAWSPDGKRLAFFRYGGLDTLTVLSVSTGKMKRIGLGYVEQVGDLAWSPDGSKIAWVRFDHHLQADRLLIASASGNGQPKELVRGGPNDRISWPVFSADGTRVLYSLTRLG
jgi:Tol biopolymer transport system component